MRLKPPMIRLPLASLRHPKLLITLGALWLGLSFLIADRIVENKLDQFLALERERLQFQGRSLAQNIEQNFELYYGITKTISSVPIVSRALLPKSRDKAAPSSRARDDSAIKALRRFFRQINHELGTDRLWVVDKHGREVGASDKGTLASSRKHKYASIAEENQINSALFGRASARLERTADGFASLMFASPVVLTETHELVGATIVRVHLTRLARWLKDSDSSLHAATGQVVLLASEPQQAKAFPEIYDKRIVDLHSHAQSAALDAPRSWALTASFPIADGELILRYHHPVSFVDDIRSSKRWLFPVIFALGVLTLAAAAGVIFVTQSQRRFRSIFEDSSVGIAVLDEELRFVEVNSEFSRFIGRSNQELRGVAFLSTIAPEDLGSSPHLENTLRNARSVSKLDKRFIRKDGQTAWGRVSSRPVRLTDLLGELKPGTIAVIEDIAELKQSEALSQEVQQKLVHAAKMSELGTMAAGIAHEINNPLMIISGKAHQLQRGLDAPDVDRQALKAAAMTIDATTNRIAKIVRGLRVFSRSSERDPFDVENPVRIIEDTLEFCREKIRNNGIELRVRLPDSASQIGSQVPCLECRASDISQVLLNLLSNAYDAVEGTPSAWIELQFTADAGSALFSVTDSGHGLPAAIIEKIMTPFFTTKAVGKGTGLGLSIARGIAVAHKGRLWYDASSPNTRFCLQLPLSQTDAPEFLPIDFDDAIAAHLKWKQRLTTELKKPTRLPQPEEVLCEPRRCALGQWLELISERSCERRSRLELSQIRKAQKLHVQFHEAARKLVVRAHRGEDLFADVVLGADSEYERSSQELMAELMRLRAHSPSADAELMT